MGKLELQRPPRDIVEIEFGTRIWSGSQAIQSIHKHIGYTLYRDQKTIKISPEFKINLLGHTEIGHEADYSLNVLPRPNVRQLIEVEESEILEIEYNDPFHQGGVFTPAQIGEFHTSRLWLLGYLIQENDEFLSIGHAKFEYVNGASDYEDPHVIPQSSILNRIHYGVETYLQPHPG